LKRQKKRQVASEEMKPECCEYHYRKHEFESFPSLRLGMSILFLSVSVSSCFITDGFIHILTASRRFHFKVTGGISKIGEAE